MTKPGSPDWYGEVGNGVGAGQQNDCTNHAGENPEVKVTAGHIPVVICRTTRIWVACSVGHIVGGLLIIFCLSRPNAEPYLNENLTAVHAEGEDDEEKNEPHVGTAQKVLAVGGPLDHALLSNLLPLEVGVFPTILSTSAVDDFNLDAIG